MPRIVSITEAKTRLSELIDAVARGEEVVIARRGRPVAALRPAPSPEEIAARRARGFGALRGKVVIHDPDWWKPLSDDELRDWYGDDFAPGSSPS
ncbi:MAG: type II toxin-antitoxin system prevent-host-death family antitoxin [Tepidiforma sp.]